MAAPNANDSRDATMDGYHKELAFRLRADRNRQRVKQRLPQSTLSTLNSMAFGLAVYASQGRSPDTTQDSLPVAGQALLDGGFTRKVPMKGFKAVIYISFPFPKLLGAPDASFAVFFLRSVASTARRKKLPFGAAVEGTDRSSDQLKV